MKRLAAFVTLVAAGLGAVVGSQAAASAPLKPSRLTRKITTTTAKPSTTTSSTTTSSTTTSTTVPAFDTATITNVRADADWLLQAQLPDGAIGHYVDRVKIWPYLANEAATGLAQATKVTGDTKYVSAVWRWLQWYQAHEDVNGFVT